MFLYVQTRAAYPLTYICLHLPDFVAVFHASAHISAHVTCTRVSIVRYFVWRMLTCHNGLFNTDEGHCPKCLYVLNS